MPRPERTLLLSAHLVSSVGWLGALAVFLVLSLNAMTSKNDAVVQGTYLALEPAGWLLLLPLSLASLVTGLMLGRLRQRWVVIKLVINVIAVIVMLVYAATLSHFAVVAADTDPSGPDLIELGGPLPAIYAGASLLLLLAAVGLSVYKPGGAETPPPRSPG